MTLKTKGMGAIIKGGKKAKEKLKKYLETKKGKDLDWDDVKASYKIFTKKK
tara:strand:- start:184 stop:336 length:153 start_codon:yes stop_codon:yes gene_type:complete